MVADRATTLGLNRPRISHGCVNPSDITLLGSLREKGAEPKASKEEPPPSAPAEVPGGECMADRIRH